MPMIFEKKQNLYDLFPSTKRLVFMMSLGIPEFRIACRAQQSCFVALLIWRRWLLIWASYRRWIYYQLQYRKLFSIFQLSTVLEFSWRGVITPEFRSLNCHPKLSPISNCVDPAFLKSRIKSSRRSSSSWFPELQVHASPHNKTFLSNSKMYSKSLIGWRDVKIRFCLFFEFINFPPRNTQGPPLKDSLTRMWCLATAWGDCDRSKTVAERGNGKIRCRSMALGSWLRLRLFPKWTETFADVYLASICSLMAPPTRSEEDC